MNGHANCILAVCCPPGSERQIAALTDEMARDLKVAATECRPYAEWVIKTFDLAPAGMLTSLKAEIARLAREGYVKATLGEPGA